MRKILGALALGLMVLAPMAAQAASPSSTKTVVQVLGPSAPASMQFRTGQGYSLPPSILCATSPGATLAYTIEVTGDQPDQYGNFLPSATWIPLDPTAVGLTGSGNFQLSGLVTAIRVNVTSYTSGTLTFEFVQ